MTLNKITLENFQSHKNTEIELHKHVNCIIGESDQGKSSIIRAIHFFYTNKWVQDYLRHGSAVTKIILENNDFTITRLKGSDKNSFILDNGEAQQSFESIGKTAIPEEIQKVLHFNPELPFNIARQSPLDLDFLMTNTSSERSTYLSIILKLDKIEDAIKELGTDINRTTRDINSAEVDIKELTQEIDKLEWTKEATVLIEKSKDNISLIQDKILKINKLYDKKDEYKQIAIAVKDIKTRLSQLSDIDFEGIDDIEEIIQKINEISKYDKKIKAIKAQALEIKERMSKFNSKYDEGVKELKSILNDLDSCPFCLSDISDDCRTDIMKEVI